MSTIQDLKSQERLDFPSLLLNFWEKKITIAILLIFISLVGIRVAYQIDLENLRKMVDLVEWIIIIIVIIIVYAGWFFSRKPTRVSKNKIGIVVAIFCENKTERQILKTDLIFELKKEISKSNSQNFDVIELSEYHSKKINSQAIANKYHKLTRGHLLIYGRCKIRSHQKEEHYVIDLEASILHKPIPIEVSKELSQEMRTLIPEQRLIPTSDELTGFSITREIIGVATRYVIGLASLLSGDPLTSFDLHVGLWNEIKIAIQIEEELSGGYTFLRVKLPKRLTIEGLALAGLAYRVKENDFLNKMDKYLTIVQEVDPRNYSAHLLRGIYYFLTDRNITKAKEEIRKSRNERDAAWQFSEAFLSAYDGDLEQAHRIYQRAFYGNVADSIPVEVEIFVKDVLDQEPSKIQLWYCLGMINYFSKGDFILAKKDFKKFIEEARKTNQFHKSTEFAQKYVTEIN